MNIYILSRISRTYLSDDNKKVKKLFSMIDKATGMRSKPVSGGTIKIEVRATINLFNSITFLIHFELSSSSVQHVH